MSYQKSNADESAQRNAYIKRHEAAAEKEYFEEQIRLENAKSSQVFGPYLGVMDTMNMHMRLFRWAWFPLLVILIFSDSNSMGWILKDIAFWWFEDPTMFFTVPPWEWHGAFNSSTMKHADNAMEFTKDPLNTWSDTIAHYWRVFVYEMDSSFYKLFK